MKVNLRLLWIYVPDAPIVKLGKLDSFSLVVGDKPLIKSYWEGFGFCFSRVEFSGVFIIDFIPLAHANAME